MEPTPIAADGYRNLFSNELTKEPNLTPEDCWKKLPKVASYSSPEPARLGGPLLRGARIGEVLWDHPDPNIVAYCGCVGREGRVASFCFDRNHKMMVESIYHDPLDLLSMSKECFGRDGEKCSAPA